MYSYNIHLVNKCNNKKFIKRYEHYKKFFYEKMEERFNKNQKFKEEKELNPCKNEKIKIKMDLNKTN